MLNGVRDLICCTIFVMQINGIERFVFCEFRFGFLWFGSQSYSFSVSWIYFWLTVRSLLIHGYSSSCVYTESDALWWFLLSFSALSSWIIDLPAFHPNWRFWLADMRVRCYRCDIPGQILSLCYPIYRDELCICMDIHSIRYFVSFQFGSICVFRRLDWFGSVDWWIRRIIQLFQQLYWWLLCCVCVFGPCSPSLDCDSDLWVISWICHGYCIRRTVCST